MQGYGIPLAPRIDRTDWANRWENWGDRSAYYSTRRALSLWTSRAVFHIMTLTQAIRQSFSVLPSQRQERAPSPNTVVYTGC